MMTCGQFLRLLIINCLLVPVIRAYGNTINIATGQWPPCLYR